MLALQMNVPADTTLARRDGWLVESRHDSVKRTIERLVKGGVIVQPPTVDEQSADDFGRVRSTSVYVIGKRDSYIIVAQLSLQFADRRIDLCRN